ncbi:uncharacterized protein LOC143174486 [Nomia melanderi]|uniref:uncharacterized protein LOC143174486 n=1 Tax=Nomia melanderi TaxID=2448451 RepID=UPI003FCD9F0B
MKSDNVNESHIQVEIQKTLHSIKQSISDIKDELNVINEFINQLGTTVIDTNKKLTITAEDMEINVAEVLNNKEKESELQLNLRNPLSSTEFQEKILACLNNT